MNFNLPDLKKFLKFIAKKYPVFPLNQWYGQKGIFLRHDLELDVKDGYKIHLLEKKYHLRSTIFVLTTSVTYNPCASKNRRMLAEISKNGFEIGLHFDPTIYGNIAIAQLQKRAKAEAHLLSTIINKKVTSISQHRPKVSANHDRYIVFKNFHNAYDPRIFSPEKYISDSRMRFLKDIYKFCEKADDQTIQILLHPDHFFKIGKNYPDKLCQYFEEFTEDVDENFKMVSSYYLTIKKEKLFDYVIKKSKK